MTKLYSSVFPFYYFSLSHRQINGMTKSTIIILYLQLHGIEIKCLAFLLTIAHSVLSVALWELNVSVCVCVLCWNLVKDNFIIVKLCQYAHKKHDTLWSVALHKKFSMKVYLFITIIFFITLEIFISVMP